MMGLEFTGEIPFSDVHIHVDHPGAGRPADVQVAGHRDRPARPDRRGPAAAGVPRRAAARSFPAYGADAVRWGLLAMSSGQDVRFAEDKVAQGQQLTNKLWNAARLILLGVGGRAARAVPARHGRGPLDPVAAEPAPRSRSPSGSRATTSPTPRCALYDFIYGELCDWYLELVKPRLRAGEPELAAHAAARADRDAGAGASDDPVRDRGDLLPRPGRRGAAGRAGRRGGRRRRIDAEAEAAVRRAIAAVQALRPWRGAGEVKAGATLPARLAADGYGETAEHVGPARPAARFNGRRRVRDGGHRADPGRGGRDPRQRRLDLGAAERKRERGRARQAAAPRSSAPSASWPTPGFVAKAPPPVVAGRAREAGATARRSWRRCPDARGGRALPALAGAVRHALRPGPHAPADDRAGHPERRFDSIHVVGTNGSPRPRG